MVEINQGPTTHIDVVKLFSEAAVEGHLKTVKKIENAAIGPKSTCA
jgi:hypothetical protein